MARAPSCLLALLLGCSSPPELVAEAYPVLSVSRTGGDIVSFAAVEVGGVAERTILVENHGTLPMGVVDIALDGSGTPAHFSVSYDLDGAVCAREEDSAIVLDGGCILPVTVAFAPLARGTKLAAVAVTTASDPGGAWLADPRDPRAVTVLRGEGLLGSGDLFVVPRTIDFGALWAGESDIEHVMIDNIGDGGLALGEPVLDAGCEAFSLGLGDFAADRWLAPGVGTMLSVTFTPTSSEGTQCTLSIPSDDPREPLVAITLLGNTGRDPDNQPPTVQIIGAELGALHDSRDPLVLQLRVSDPDQPADSLVCTVSASAQLGGVLGSCTPDAAGGLADFTVDPGLLDPGTESLLVTVTDMAGRQAQASTTVRWLAPLPEGDGDGDGFGDDDCDDSNAGVYPGAAELADGVDNDCDLAVDEGTDAADDDGDSLSEWDGDCDDSDAATYPGAPEVADFEDNDCDGTVDEGTAAYDGDGDGYAFQDGDCDDRDPDRSPAALEYCGDGVDNDCDYALDERDPEGCEAVETRPVVVGGCQLGQRALAVGDVTTLAMIVYDPDTSSDALQYSWTLAPPGLTALSTASLPVTVLQAPTTLPSGSDEESLIIAGVVEDTDGSQAWCSEAITVRTEPIPALR